jgi:hypothetical protein
MWKGRGKMIIGNNHVKDKNWSCEFWRVKMIIGNNHVKDKNWSCEREGSKWSLVIIMLKIKIDLVKGKGQNDHG